MESAQAMHRFCHRSRLSKSIDDTETATNQCLCNHLTDWCVQGNAEDRYAAIKADREAEAVPAADVDGKTLTKKQRVALEKEAEKERAKRSKLVEGRLEPQVAFTTWNILLSWHFEDLHCIHEG